MEDKKEELSPWDFLMYYLHHQTYNPIIDSYPNIYTWICGLMESYHNAKLLEMEEDN